MADDKNGGQAATATVEGKAGKRRSKRLTKVEAVRRAMAALGREATRSDIQGYVRQKFNVQMSLDHISNCKGELAKRKAKAATAGGPKGAAAHPSPAASRKSAAPEPRSAQPSPAQQGRTTTDDGSSGASILLEDVLTAKALIDRVGAGPLKRLIDGLAR